MKTRAILLAIAALAAASASAQTAPQPLGDEQQWVQDIRAKISDDEIHTAAAEAEVQQSSDPLVALVDKYKIEAPDWLKQRVGAQSASATLASLGDSVTAAMASCSSPYYFCPENSWSTGELATSVKKQLEAGSGREVHGFLVSVPGVTASAVPAEAFVVWLANFFGLNVERMTLLIGHNDPGVCGDPDPAADAKFQKNIATSLRILGRVAAKRHAKLFLSSLIDVTAVARYADVVPNGQSKTCTQLWAATPRCSPLLQHRDDPAAAQRIRDQTARYDAVLSQAAAGKDWVLYTPVFGVSSGRGVPDPAADLSPYDCFHPSAAGQARLGQAAWYGDAGAPGVASFFTLVPAVAR